jgi:beta-barrel assembly-enhancing protease
MDAFRSGMLLLALGAFGTLAPAATQSPPVSPAAAKEKPAAQQPGDPSPQPSPPVIVVRLPDTPVQPPSIEDEKLPPPAARTGQGTSLAADSKPADPPPPLAVPTGDAVALPPVIPPPAPRKTKKVMNFWSPEQETEMGKRLDSEMLSQVQLLEDPVVTDYLEEVTARLARSSDVKVPVVLRVVSSSQPDAFSLPGGYIYITAGMVKETRSEAELAAVLSHEVAHVACRHATRQLTKRQLMSLLAIPLMFVGGPVGFAIGEGFSLAYPLALLKFSRNAESEADAVGLGYMEASGYDPAASISLFERLSSGESSRMPGLRRLLSTHPITKDRLAAAEHVIDQLPTRDEYVLSTSRYEEATARLSHLGFNHDPGIPALVRRTGHAGAEP